MVRDHMTTDVLTVAPEATMADVVALLKTRHVRHLPVVDADGHVLGILSDRDVRARVTGPLSWLPDAEIDDAMRKMLAREVMTDEPITLPVDASMAQAAQVLLDKEISCLPVVDDGKLVGILTERDFVRAVATPG